MKTLISLAEFWDLLNAHDFYYEMSDDHRVYEKGSRSERQINAVLALAREGGEKPEYERLHSEWVAFVNGETDAGKPERPI
jgi:hypothetical protein